MSAMHWHNREAQWWQLTGFVMMFSWLLTGNFMFLHFNILLTKMFWGNVSLVDAPWKCIVSFASNSDIFIWDFSHLQNFRFFFSIHRPLKRLLQWKKDEALCCPLLDNTNNYFLGVQSSVDFKHLHMIRTSHQDSLSWECDAPCRGVVTSTICGISLGQKDWIQLKLSEVMSAKFLQIRKKKNVITWCILSLHRRLFQRVKNEMYVCFWL